MHVKGGKNVPLPHSFIITAATFALTNINNHFTTSAAEDVYIKRSSVEYFLEVFTRVRFQYKQTAERIQMVL